MTWLAVAGIFVAGFVVGAAAMLMFLSGAKPRLW